MLLLVNNSDLFKNILSMFKLISLVISLVVILKIYILYSLSVRTTV